MTNWEKCARWIRWTIRAAVTGAFVVAVVVAAIVPTGDRAGWAMLGAAYGFAIAAVPPGAIAAWFLFLHMTGQVSSAIREPERRKKKRRRTD